MEIGELHAIMSRIESEIAALRSDFARLEERLAELQKAVSGDGDGLNSLQSMAALLANPKVAGALSKALGEGVGGLAPLLMSADVTADEAGDRDVDDILRALTDLSPEASRAVRKLRRILPLATAVRSRRYETRPMPQRRSRPRRDQEYDRGVFVAEQRCRSDQSRHVSLRHGCLQFFLEE